LRRKQIRAAQPVRGTRALEHRHRLGRDADEDELTILGTQPLGDCLDRGRRCRVEPLRVLEADHEHLDPRVPDGFVERGCELPGSAKEQ
jgi:hypothetical protein